MFEFIRSHTRLFQFILVLLVFPSFVFFGVQGYSRFREAGQSEVARVDGRRITQNEWDQAHARSVERLRERMPNVDAKLLDTPAMKRETLDALVRERVLLAAAQSQHLFPSDERLASIFRNDPQYAPLRNPDGSVNRDLLAAQGLSSEGFVQQLRLELGMRQVLAAVGSTGVTSKSVAATAMEAVLQRRKIELQRFEVKDYLAKVAPSDADLEAYYGANESRFRLPEVAQIEYVVLDLESVQKGVAVSDEELRRYYAENAARYTAAEERRASHILVTADKDAAAAERQKARARAEALLAEVRRTPGRFAEIAAKNSQDPGSAAKGGDLDFFGRGAMVKPFEDAVFAMKAGEISNVVETDFGYHVIQLTGQRGGEKKAFEAVRGEVEAEVRRQLAQRRFAENAEAFTNTVYEQSDSLQPVIEKFKLEKKTAMVHRTPAPNATGVLASPKLLEAVFKDDSLRNKRNTDAVDVGNNQLVSARVVTHTPARTQPLADVKDRVREAVVQGQAAELARKEGEARLARLKAAPATALPQALTVSRIQPQGLSANAVAAVLQASADKLPALVGVDLGAQGYLIARVVEVLPRDTAGAPEAALESQYTQAWTSAEMALYVDALKKRYDTEVKAQAGPADAAAPAASR
jgi:peptidyl-prolyl cis-trans isomerase D